MTLMQLKKHFLNSFKTIIIICRVIYAGYASSDVLESVTYM